MGIFARKNKNPKNHHLTNVKYLGSLPSVAQMFKSEYSDSRIGWHPDSELVEGIVLVL